MKRTLVIGALLVGLASPAFAHRVDEYLQAATLLVSAGRLDLSMRLAPGTAVVTTVLDSIDVNRDGAISEAEGRGYANQVLTDLYVSLDKTPVVLRLDSWRSSTVEELRSGQGEIHLEFSAALPVGGSQRRLVFENRHRSPIAAYLVNALVPEGEIRISGQTRNYRQSVYELSYEQASSGAASVSFETLLRWGLVFAAVAIIVGNAMALRKRAGNAPETTSAPAARA